MVELTVVTTRSLWSLLSTADSKPTSTTLLEVAEPAVEKARWCVMEVEMSSPKILVKAMPSVRAPEAKPSARSLSINGKQAQASSWMLAQEMFRYHDMIHMKPLVA